MLRRLGAAAIVALVVLALFLNSRPNSEDVDSSAGLNKAGSPKLTLLGGGEFTLEGLRGQPYILEFWASWCTPCRLQMPLVKSFYKGLLQEGCLNIIAVNTGEPTYKVENFIKAHPMPYPVVLDQTGSFAREMGVTALPTLLMIGSEGSVVGRRSGYSGDVASYLKSSLHPSCQIACPSKSLQGNLLLPFPLASRSRIASIKYPNDSHLSGTPTVRSR